MYPGTIVMLIFIIVVVFGSAGWLVRLNVKSESEDHKEIEEDPKEQ